MTVQEMASALPHALWAYELKNDILNPEVEPWYKAYVAFLNLGDYPDNAGLKAALLHFGDPKNGGRCVNQPMQDAWDNLASAIQ